MIGNIHLSELSNEVIEYINNSNNSTPAIYGELNYEKGAIRVLNASDVEYDLPITLDYDLNDLMFVYLNGRLLRESYYEINKETGKIIFNSLSLKQGDDIDIYLLSIINRCGEHPGDGGGTGGGTISNITKEQLAEALRAEIDGKALAAHTHTDIIEMIPDVATSEQATAGIDDTTIMTPKKTKEAIIALGGAAGTVPSNITKEQLHVNLQAEIDGKAAGNHNHDLAYSPIIHTHQDIIGQIPEVPVIASTEQATAGIDDTTIMTPKKTKEAIAALGVTGKPTDITKEQLAESLKSEIDGKAPTVHNHDLAYSPIVHTHEDIIAQIPEVPALASLEQATGGVDNTTIMTPVRVKEAINKFASGVGTVENITKSQLDLALQTEIDNKALKDHNHDTTYSKTDHTHQNIIDMIPDVATTQQAQEGVDNTTMMTPARVKEAITALATTEKPTNIEKTQLSVELQSEIDGKALSTHDHDIVYSKISHTHEDIIGQIPELPAISSTDQATTGIDDITMMTPKKTKEAITAIVPTIAVNNITKSQLHTDLQGEIDGKALSTHNHDEVYSKTAHTHDGVYSPVVHEHADIVAKIPQLASNEQATSGVDNTTIMTPIRVKEAITAIAPTITVQNISKSQLDSSLQGEIDGKATSDHNHDTVYSLKVHTHEDIIELIPDLPSIASTEQAQAGLDNTTMMTPARVKEAITAIGSTGIQNITKAQLHVDLQGEIDGKAAASHTHTDIVENVNNSKLASAELIGTELVIKTADQTQVKADLARLATDSQSVDVKDIVLSGTILDVRYNDSSSKNIDLSGISSSSPASTNIKQYVFLNVTASQEYTKPLDLVDTDKIIIQPYKFIPGEQNIVSTIKEFNNAEKQNFIYDPENVIFTEEGMQIKNEFVYTSVAESDYYKSQEINKADFIGDIQIYI